MFNYWEQEFPREGIRFVKHKQYRPVDACGVCLQEWAKTGGVAVVCDVCQLLVHTDCASESNPPPPGATWAHKRPVYRCSNCRASD